MDARSGQRCRCSGAACMGATASFAQQAQLLHASVQAGMTELVLRAHHMGVTETFRQQALQHAIVVLPCGVLQHLHCHHRVAPRACSASASEQLVNAGAC